MHVRKQVNKQGAVRLRMVDRAVCFPNPEEITNRVIVLAFRLEVTTVTCCFGSVGGNAYFSSTPTQALIWMERIYRELAKLS